MHRKSKTFEKFKEFRAKTEKQLNKSLKALQSDRRGEYFNSEFEDHLKRMGWYLNSLHQEHHNRMVLPKGEIECY